MSSVIKFTPAHPLNSIDRNQLKLCKHCKHFAQPQKGHIAYGYCKLFGEVSLVDGSVEYMFAKNVREHYCKGKFFSVVESQQE